MTLRHRCNALSTELPSHMDSLVAQWIEHCTGIARSWVRILFKPEFFFRLLFQLLKLIAHCEDQISLTTKTTSFLFKVSQARNKTSKYAGEEIEILRGRTFFGLALSFLSRLAIFKRKKHYRCRATITLLQRFYFKIVLQLYLNTKILKYFYTLEVNIS